MFKQLWATKLSQPSQDSAEGLSMQRVLGVWGLTALGIGAVIGGGIFVITGQAAANHAGPAIMLSFALAAICCTFCALAYAEFAAMVPVSGSAYTYTYATFGELAAWFIGWMLVLEYGVSAAAVAVSWSGYFLSLLQHLGIHLPAALVNAPLDGTLHATGAIANLPAATIVLLLTWLCYFGIRKSSKINIAMVALKSGLILLIIGVGWKYVNPDYWQPFIPTNQGPGKYGWNGVLHGASMVFFAYIGFEAVSVAAQESHRPQRDLPISMMSALAICTVLYIMMAAVMTGLVPYTQLGTDEPVVTAVAAHPQLGWLRVVVEIGALVGLSSVVLVMLIGQPRIFMIMAGDGLLPPIFSTIHSKHRTPHINTVITGLGIALLAAVFPLDVLGELTSMGTLIAFTAVCAGVLILRCTRPDLPRPFRMPAAWLFCSAGVLSCITLLSAMTRHNWMLMSVWTVLGFSLYFSYGYRHSKLHQEST
ncbi:amino acid permease [Xylella fastidiosa]|jgi:APA family basic amino acid/polyamine antiporter|uniref:Cationic amino acid transporter n=1 Tax=Xylella fastidiosa (strain Temecula1 / ATCC 700964) TaxID=183190 RepID=Q87C39_XYLFT|nr:amino acid permease [Xylella fastidiosa]ADN62097.1 cationic amino acid transporter [Xylella fastidiosa subsp. fastidiosa GB514]KAF0570571.1 amino acid permease [Xylella fastidiosa subsp. fastidiosa Mus-1]AAO29106.1 cationic amino acid transporter [Xylella fastidiosa Temecula1]EGO82482.1 Amino acid transporter [Xylella fastidiosa EB92.1]KGM19981.1 amino acid permease [Xylella fastidiosa]